MGRWVSCCPACRSVQALRSRLIMVPDASWARCSSANRSCLARRTSTNWTRSGNCAARRRLTSGPSTTCCPAARVSSRSACTHDGYGRHTKRSCCSCLWHQTQPLTTLCSIGPETVDLLDKLLVCNPRQRLSAVQALDHDYFWTDPLPADPKSYVVPLIRIIDLRSLVTDLPCLALGSLPTRHLTSSTSVVAAIRLPQARLFLLLLLTVSLDHSLHPQVSACTVVRRLRAKPSATARPQYTTCPRPAGRHPRCTALTHQHTTLLSDTRMSPPCPHLPRSRPSSIAQANPCLRF